MSLLACSRAFFLISAEVALFIFDKDGHEYLDDLTEKYKLVNF